jgi:hypothetical protein
VSPSIDQFLLTFRQKHFLSGILLEHVQSTLQMLTKSKDESIITPNPSGVLEFKKISVARQQRHYGLHILLTAILSDVREELSAIYFPALPYVCNDDLLEIVYIYLYDMFYFTIGKILLCFILMITLDLNCRFRSTCPATRTSTMMRSGFC